MLMFEEIQARGHESVTLLHHAPSGLRAVLAVHSTVLGPAIAGCRLMPCTEERAVRDALALSESVTLKAALAGLNYGGGACVMLPPEGGDIDGHAREALFRALGRQIRYRGGRVILTEDVGVTGRDIAFAAQETDSTMGMHTDTPTVTAYGVYRGIKAAARAYLGGESMRGVRVALLGAGAVGRTLAQHLHREGARLTVADLMSERAQALADDLGERVTVVSAADIFDVPCDVFAPCAFGHSIKSADVPRLQCRVIAGSEHHPLSHNGETLVREAGITYIPDFAINSAGLMSAAQNLSIETAAERVYESVAQICATAQKYEKPPHVVARKLALRRIELIGSISGQYAGQ
ncbi:Glu/Leu/Phe/Val dehydrogenase family protein [Deinococcus maricopensis]|uniref:Leucine dehydrogenase n=1 Tax=Deinococcus maricopensis (strain DSM 21211 / LMG 22137 / NRRL B-23946 / LB-34) TaxID=709986 RepID=E8U4Y1_DEIML|nr:Glu/Leu/Phe/Val dehydrogenase dimerization domain-containing protein [Deinococcus maricopensis]ADV66120.1 Leucine dehydrogenase [Deinococcus maricopensis DSM 21211]